MVFQFANDIRAGKKVCYTLSRCPHRLAAKDATLSRWISRVRIPLGAPQNLRSPLPIGSGLFATHTPGFEPDRVRIPAPSQGLWAKNGKYEYCYLFSNSQNSPICCPHGLQAPLNYSNSSIAGLYVLRLMNIFSVMSIILCRQYDTTIATVLIFAIFCPQGVSRGTDNSHRAPRSATPSGIHRRFPR